MDFTLTQEQYEALISLAKVGVEGDPTKIQQLEVFLRDIEKSNGIERDFLWVQWQELGEELQVGSVFPDNYPPELRRTIELITRKIAKVDVDAVLEEHANDPTNVLVTRDPAGKAGWTAVDEFFIT